MTPELELLNRIAYAAAEGLDHIEAKAAAGYVPDNRWFELQIALKTAQRVALNLRNSLEEK